MSKNKNVSQAQGTGDNLKRKASLGSEATAEEIEKPLSKREMKRRAKKARLEAGDGAGIATGSGATVASG
jgi:ribonuclease P/MRP protein subunit RPP1